MGNKILILGDYASYFDHKTGQPFSDGSGVELTKMLHEAGLLWTECDKLNINGNDVPQGGRWKGLFIKDTPVNRIPTEKFQANMDRIRDFIDKQDYNLILCFGEAALWAMTGNRGIGKWRGSQLEYKGIPLLATHHPRDIQRVWEWRFIAVHDLGRAKDMLEGKRLTPEYNFIIRPSYQLAVNTLQNILKLLIQTPTKLSVDIETRSGHIACIGFAWTHLDAICIPLMCTETPAGFWSREEEFVLVRLMSEILTHKNALVIGQNFIYDSQYIARFWGILPKVHLDTMIAHAVCYPGLPKGLDFLSSLYCDYHLYWKDESKDWSPKLGEEQLWIYNCKDCVTTFEVAEVLEHTVKHLGLEEQAAFERDLIEPVLYMMLRGVRIDMKARSEMFHLLTEALQKRELWFEKIFPGLKLAKSKTAKPWYRSPTQQQKLFYEMYKVPVCRSKSTGRPTCNDNALSIIGKKEPLLYPVCQMLAEYRSIGVFLKTFVQAPLDADHRMRCSYNPVGTETFRFNSSADAFGFGTNLQNIPKGDE